MSYGAGPSDPSLSGRPLTPGLHRTSCLSSSLSPRPQHLVHSSLFPVKAFIESSTDAKGVYESKHVAHAIFKNGLAGLSAGILAATYQNAVKNEAKKWYSVFTQFGSTIRLFTMVPAAYAGTRALAANIQQRDHWSNAVIGGAAAGFLIGISRGRFLPGVAGAVLAGGAGGWYEFTVPPGTPVYKIDQNALERYKRVEAHHLQRKKWEDINPPPGKGYCIEAYPGYTKSYTDNLAPAAPY